MVTIESNKEEVPGKQSEANKEEVPGKQSEASKKEIPELRTLLSSCLSFQMTSLNLHHKQGHNNQHRDRRQHQDSEISLGQQCPKSEQPETSKLEQETGQVDLSMNKTLTLVIQPPTTSPQYQT